MLPARTPLAGGPTTSGPLGRLRSQSGTTLPEILISIVILGTTVIALMSGLGVAVSTSDSNQKLATADLVLRNYSESVTNAVRVRCQAGTSFAGGIDFSPPAGFVVTPTQRRSNGSAEPLGTCPTSTSYSEVDVAVRSTDGRANDSLTIAVYAP